MATESEEEEPPASESQVCRFLSARPDFARTWFAQNASRDMVQDWLSSHGGPRLDETPVVDTGPAVVVQEQPGTRWVKPLCRENCLLDVIKEELLLPTEDEEEEDLSSSAQDPTGEDDNSLSASYAEVTRRGRNSVTSELFRDIVHNSGSRRRRRERSCDRNNRVNLKSRLGALSEPEILMELIRDISNELDIDTLCHKILVNVGLLTHSDRSSLFLAKGSRGQRYLMAKLFDVTPDSGLEEALAAAEKHCRIPPIPFGVGIAGHVAQTKETVTIQDAYQDPRFNKEIDSRTGYRTVSLMCLPILNFHGDVIGVAQCINKGSVGQPFTEQDAQVFHKYLTFCGIGIQNAQLFEMSVLEYKRNQLLLTLAQSIFQESYNLERLINKIMSEAQSLLQCFRCRVFLIDTDQKEGQSIYQRERIERLSKISPDFRPRKFSKPEDVVFGTVFELRSGEESVKNLSLNELLQDGPNSAHVCFARHVAATGQTYNWLGQDDEHSTNGFGEALAEGLNPSGHVLSLPIFNSDGKVIGVAQFVDKASGEPFTELDVKTFEAFSIFCGLGIYNTQMYENAIKLMAKQRVALEVLSYHASSSVEEAQRLAHSTIPLASQFQLSSFQFSDLSLSDIETCQATIRMFKELDLFARFHVQYEIFCRWLLSVKKNYRPVLYHNWRHAFNVTQTMFAMLTTGKMGDLMTDIEILALLVATLCHDLDHRGTNNSFQTKIESPLATLYSTSTMEHHHFDQCVMILNSEGNNILQSLSPDEYRKVIRIIEVSILSTDLALYFKKKDGFCQLVENGETDWKDSKKKELLRGMMMTACDISAISKPWNVQKHVAELVASEFFEQGDLEKERLKQTPIAMMDRERKGELPGMQVDFIDCICLPVYKILSECWPALRPFYDGCLTNRKHWEQLTLDSPSSADPEQTDVTMASEETCEPEDQHQVALS